MAIPLKVPEVGESITEVEVGEWLKGEGDNVERDEDVVIIETEKATVQIAAPQSGTITKILKQSGEKAKVGEIIGQLEEQVQPAGASPQKDDSLQKLERREERPEQARANGDQKQAAEPVQIVPDAEKEKEIDQAAEAAENIALQNAAETEQHHQIASKSSEDPKVTREQDRPVTGRPEIREVTRPERPDSERLIDMMRHREDINRRGIAEAAEVKRVTSAVAEPSRREETTVRMSFLRRRIAERLVQAQQTAALLTTFNEIDMTSVIELRNRYRESFQERHRVKLGFMSFFVKAAIEALKLVPELNAEIRGENIHYRKFYDIGVAVGGGEGLVVPVIRSAERLSFAELESMIADFAQRARENRLKPDELTGGTFTISNGGIYGSLLSTPIINPPQSGILGMHAIQDRPVARDGTVAIRPMMYVAVTYDHRLVDGREAVTFLKHIKTLVEEPARMLLEI